MKKLFSFFTVVISLFAIIINFNYFDRPFPQDFANGAYNILLKAEEYVLKGRVDEAVECFKIAMMRSKRCGRNGVYERIKTRLATAGCEIIEKEPQSALNLLTAYSLFAKNFDKTATVVESFVLNKSKGKLTTFSYPLIYKNGKRTFWLESPKISPIFLYRKLPQETELYKYPGNLIYLKAGDLPAEGNFGLYYPLLIGCPQGTRAFDLIVSSEKRENNIVIIGTNDSCSYYRNVKVYTQSQKTMEIFTQMYQRNYFVLNSIIVISDKPFAKDINLYLVRKYEQL